MKFQDYYKTLELPRTATQQEITKAFRKLARKYHPDLNTGPGAEDKFKLVNEANEVLSDPAKRARYDQLGENWQAGQEFQPPPGWENIFEQFSGGGTQRRRAKGGRRGGAQMNSFHFGGGSGFSDFFDTLFGETGGRVFSGSGSPMFEQDGQTLTADMTISLEEAYHGGTKAVSLTTTERNGQGLAELKTKNYNIKIPPGTTEEQIVRLKGMGSKGAGGGADGDLMITVHIAPHSRMKLEGKNISTSLPIAPWEAALGARVNVSTLDGNLTLTIPPGSQSGQRLRLRGKGLPSGKSPGDLLVELKIQVPRSLTEQEHKAFEDLAAVSKFNPRECKE